MERLLAFVLTDGGLAGFVWGYIAIVIGFMFVYASLGEMASMFVKLPPPSLTNVLKLIWIPGRRHQEVNIIGCLNLPRKAAKNS